MCDINKSFLKIHPAIAVARLSNNDEYFIFDKKNKPTAYKSETDIRGAKMNTMKRQGVQFRIYEYSKETGKVQREYKADGTTFRIVWKTKVSNRKQASGPNGSQDPNKEMKAYNEATETEKKPLIAYNPFKNDQPIQLGEIWGNGVFLPGHGGIYNAGGKIIDNSGGEGMYSRTQVDTTCDGWVTVEIQKRNGSQWETLQATIFPAAIVVAPQDHAPDITPDQWKENNRLCFGLDSFLKRPENLNIPTPSPGELQGLELEIYELDKSAIEMMNGEFNPGMEVCLDNNFTPDIPSNLKDAFFNSGSKDIGKFEIRPKFTEFAGGNGVNPGNLTSGLCSTWQGDMTQCIRYWNAAWPPNNKLHEQSQDARPYFATWRIDYKSDVELRRPKGWQVANYMDVLGVIRVKPNTDPLNNNNRYETERSPAENIPSA